MASTGHLVIISGPSGSGKTTVLKRMFEQSQRPLVASVSATTRAPRPGEIDGRDYHFLDRDEFLRRRAEGEFLETFEVYGRGDWYGTLLAEVAPRLAAGKWVVLEIDVNGAMQVLERYPDALTIFILPESLAELERRLRGRGTESAEALERRLAAAQSEMKLADRYRYRVVNRDLDQAVNEICLILESNA